MNIPDAPDIRMTEATGYPAEVKWPRCPICGQECETLYKSKNGAVVGCDECIETADAWEEMDHDK